jgi:aspartyl-tRNA(Asn)/glutamyl-tRNA(Gln) amidotransferase subunit A
MLGDRELTLRANIGLYAQPISFVGLPILTVPVPLSPMPIGIQIITAPWCEDVAFALACALEREGIFHPPQVQRN